MVTAMTAMKPTKAASQKPVGDVMEAPSIFIYSLWFSPVIMHQILYGSVKGKSLQSILKYLLALTILVLICFLVAYKAGIVF